MVRQAMLKRQQGLTSVEFALAGTVLFIVLFGLIELGRLLFTWNVLDEATRRAARLAVVCPVTTEGQLFAREQGAFGGTLLPQFTAANVAIRYLQEDGSTPATSTSNTYYVQSAIVGYSHQMLIPFFDISLDALDFVTTLPAESLGVHPVAAGAPPCGS
ncbi:TadE/TadG family type IV pilus assembly protein [Marinobacterium marinum]|uniref:Pilus assembly protein n=1 Tax=Marinobacterium marinum TaxID=2756129 RepID=A0A7W2ABE7_9GAMM|nr:TadE family protein [Marinobacterium marinum]MBA4501417.1 pilus assembly protein [Marinobacterium marinum]